MNGKTVRNTVLISLVLVLVLTLTIQPAVCLQTTFTYSDLSVYAEEITSTDPQSRIDALNDKNKTSEKEPMKIGDEDVNFEDAGEVDGHQKIIPKREGSKTNNIVSQKGGSTDRGYFSDINITVPDSGEFTLCVVISNSNSWWQSYMTITVTDSAGNKTDVTIEGKQQRGGWGSQEKTSTYYIKQNADSMEAVTDINDLGWFTSGTYTVSLSGYMNTQSGGGWGQSSSVLEFYIVYK